MKTLRTFACLALTLMLVCANTAWADLYHWTDENGVRHYSNTRPPEGEDASEYMEEIPYDPQTDSKRRAVEDAMLQERESAKLKERLEEAERNAEEARRQAEEAKRKAERLEKELEEKEDEPSYGVYYYRRYPGHRPPGWRPPGYRPPGHRPPGRRPHPETHDTTPEKPGQKGRPPYQERARQ